MKVNKWALVIVFVLIIAIMVGCVMCQTGTMPAATSTPEPSIIVMVSLIPEPSIIATPIPTPTPEPTHAEIAKAILDKEIAKNKSTFPGQYTPVEIQGSYLVYMMTAQSNKHVCDITPYICGSETLPDGKWKVFLGYNNKNDYNVSLENAWPQLLVDSVGYIDSPINVFEKGDHPNAFFVICRPDTQCILWSFHDCRECRTGIWRFDAEKIYMKGGS